MSNYLAGDLFIFVMFFTIILTLLSIVFLINIYFFILNLNSFSKCVRGLSLQGGGGELKENLLLRAILPAIKTYSFSNKIFAFTFFYLIIIIIIVFILFF